MSAAAIGHSDPGVQPERTLLSWSRTVLLLLVIAGFFIRWAPYYGGTVLVLFASAAVMAAAIWVSQRRRYALAVQGISQEQYPPAIGSAAALSCGVVVLGLSAVAFLLLT